MIKENLKVNKLNKVEKYEKELFKKDIWTR